MLLLFLFLLSLAGMWWWRGHSDPLDREALWSLMSGVFCVWCAWLPIAAFAVIRYWKQVDKLFLLEFVTSLSIFSLV